MTLCALEDLSTKKVSYKDDVMTLLRDPVASAEHCPIRFDWHWCEVSYTRIHLCSEPHTCVPIDPQLILSSLFRATFESLDFDLGLKIFAPCLVTWCPQPLCFNPLSRFVSPLLTFDRRIASLSSCAVFRSPSQEFLNLGVPGITRTNHS